MKAKGNGNGNGSASRADREAAEAITALLDAHGGKLYGLGLKICGSHEEAEDLVQETFLNAFRKWHQFEGRSDPATWLYTIAVRVCRRRHRRRAGQPRYLEPLVRLLPSGEEGVVDLPAPEEGPLDEQLREEAREAVEDALTHLPMTYRMPLVLKDIAEFSTAEVAQVMGLQEGTVKTRVHRARMALRKELAAELPRRAAGPATHARHLCLDLLQAKQEALDRGVEFPMPQSELCERCQALFRTLDLTQDACRYIGEGQLPAQLRSKLVARMKAREGSGAELPA